MTGADENQLQIRDAMDPARAAALFAALGLGDPPGTGVRLPPFFHQIYFWDAQPSESLGRDGHPRLGTGLVPDMGLPRRMWAGGRFEFLAPLRSGQEAVKRSRVVKAERKAGRSGPLAFVTLLHDISQGGRTVLREAQDLVYREDPDPAAPAPKTSPAPGGEDSRTARGFSTTELFRYSALTFNGHRIHYDPDYAQNVEGYRGLVVHGPFLAQLLMLKAEAELGELRRFSFRATAPVIQGEEVDLCRKGGALWVRGADGRLCMEATAEV